MFPSAVLLFVFSAIWYMRVQRKDSRDGDSICDGDQM